MNHEILVVDDDKKTVSLIRLYLEREGYRVSVAYDGRETLELVRERVPGLIVLDVMLPQVDGVEVCHRLRKELSVPIIMLTARTTEEDKLMGLDTGADDYVTKPFSPRELVARIRAVLRRTGSTGDDAEEWSFGALTVDLRCHEVRIHGKSIRLTPREFGLLRVLAREPGRVFTRLDLLERAFDLDYDGLERTVDVHIGNLRRKIEPDPSRPTYVVTVQGVGYKFVGEKNAP